MVVVSTSGRELDLFESVLVLFDDQSKIIACAELVAFATQKASIGPTDQLQLTQDSPFHQLVNV